MINEKENQGAAAPRTATPGPWTVKEWEHGDTDVLCDGSRVASVDRWKNSNTTYANAQLIAAAPEMYETLKRCLECMEESEGRWVILPNEIRRIIWRIEGSMPRPPSGGDARLAAPAAPKEPQP